MIAVNASYAVAPEPDRAVLVVDAGVAIAHMLAARYAVHVAGDLANARAALRRLRPAAIVCEVQLLDGDGYALLAELRARRDRVPFVFLSAHSGPSERARGIRAGADDFLGKPCALDELAARIDAAIARTDDREAALATQRETLLAELHDGACGTMTRAALVLASRADGRELAQQILREGLDDTRALLSALETDHQPWAHVIADIRREAADACFRAGLHCTFALAESDVRLSAAEALALERAAREALTNVLKHAGARAVHVELALARGFARLVVEDDGHGPGMRDPASGRGLRMMEQRVARLGGAARFEARTAGGGRLVAKIRIASITAGFSSAP